MIRDSYNIVPMSMAVLMHVLLAASMLMAFDFSARKPPPMPLVIKGTLVADSTIVAPPRVEKPAPPVEQPAPPPEPVVDTEAVEQARIAAEEEKRRQDALVEQQRLEEMRRVQEAEAERKREEEAKRQREAEEKRQREDEARRLREEEAELERQRQQAERERLQEIERQRLENERLRREAEQAQFADAVAQEDARLQAMNSNEMAAYQFALQQTVLRNWARPASARAGLDCLVQVRQSATGEVISANVVSCNGDAAVERSIEAAVYKASPLPLPENAVLFDPNLRFRFIPEQ